MTSDTADREITTTRLLNAHREKVWEAWTDPHHIVKWWGPNGFTNTIQEMDVRPGGKWTFIMHGPDGTDYPNKVLFIEVVKPERLVYDHGDAGEMDHFHVTVTFEEEDDKTKLTMQMVFDSQEKRDMVIEKYGALEGQKQTFDRMEQYLTTL